MPSEQPRQEEAFIRPLEMPAQASQEEINKEKKVELISGHLKSINEVLTLDNFHALNGQKKNKKILKKVVNNLKVIKNYIEYLVDLIKESDDKINPYSHLIDRLGQFDLKLGVVRRITAGKEDAESLAEFEDFLESYKNYFTSCVDDPEFLKKELNSKEGSLHH